LRRIILLLGFGDDGLGDFDGIFHIVQIEVGMHVIVEEFAGFIVGEAADIIAEPLMEVLALRLIDIVFE
jgi:hypothetical protein